MSFPDVRPRRLRRSPALRRLVEETRVSPAELVLPLFLKEGLTEPRAISSLPGVVQHSRESLRKAAHEAVTAGVAFLAAGAIFRSQGDVKGLTTGAGMWLAGAIGVACGAGYGVLAVMATALAAIILVAVRWLEGHFKTKDDEHPSDAT